MTVIAGCVGVTAALLLRRAIPALLVGVVGAFAGWIAGGAFGLPASFGEPLASAAIRLFMAAAMVALTARVYHRRVRQRE